MIDWSYDEFGNEANICVIDWNKSWFTSTPLTLTEDMIYIYIYDIKYRIRKVLNNDTKLYFMY